MKADKGNESGRWPPRRCEMPDLSNLSAKLTVNYILNYTFGNAGLQMGGSGQYQFLNLIRLVDKTLLEYEQARDYLQRYVDSHNKTSLFLRCVDHMETCVDSLHRVFLHLEGLKASLHEKQERTARTNESLPQIRRGELPGKNARKRIRRIRHAMQHMDERIGRGEAGADIAPIGLNVKSNSIELDHEEVYFAELASWIRQMHEFAEQLTTYTPSA
jgi:hypothetical protein